MNVALVYDRVNKWGGAERVLLALHKIWPEAPLFTAVYDRKRAPWADVFDVRPSFLQNLPFAKYAHESLPMLTPIAFESFDFDGFDVVISVTSAEAKNIITKPGTVHICYCLTPTRYLWSGFEQYARQPGLGFMSGIASRALRALAPALRSWDIIAGSRPDHYIAISKRVKARIERYYHRTVADIMYPPVDTTTFSGRTKHTNTKDSAYYLTVARMVSYKKLDIIVEAFNRLGLPLVVIGDGRQRSELTRNARHNITFIHRHLTDSELVRYYEGCRAFIFAADEDFGLSAAEAQAMGKPVIGYRHSGIAEFVSDGVTGILFDEQSPESVIQAVTGCSSMTFSESACRVRAEQMDEIHFRSRMLQFVTNVLRK